MKNSFGPAEADKALVIIFILALVLIIMLPKHTVFDPAVSFYATIYQEMYPNNVTILDHQQRVKSYEVLFSTSASKEMVFAWYDAQYSVHGWIHIRGYNQVQPETMYRF